MANEIDFENERIPNFQRHVTYARRYATWHTVMHHSSTSTYTPNVIRIGETFRRRTDGRTDIKAGFIRSTRRKFNVKWPFKVTYFAVSEKANEDQIILYNRLMLASFLKDPKMWPPKGLNIDYPNIVLRLLSREPLANIRINLVLSETSHWGLSYIFVADSLFIQIFVVDSERYVFLNRVRNGPSRSFKVVDFGTNRKRVCDFLLVINSNLGPVLPRFRDTAGFLLRRATLPLFHPNFGVVPLGLYCQCYGSEVRRPLTNYLYN